MSLGGGLAPQKCCEGGRNDDEFEIFINLLGAAIFAKQAKADVSTTMIGRIGRLFIIDVCALSNERPCHCEPNEGRAFP